MGALLVVPAHKDALGQGVLFWGLDRTGNSQRCRASGPSVIHRLQFDPELKSKPVTAAVVREL